MYEWLWKCEVIPGVGRIVVELVRNLVAHSDAREGKWWGNWRMEWVAITLTPPPNVMYPALLKLMRTPRLPAVDWTDAPTYLKGLVRFGERRNLVSARVPSRSARAKPPAPWKRLNIRVIKPERCNWPFVISEYEDRRLIIYLLCTPLRFRNYVICDI